MNYYEHHIGDYAEATAHLSFVEDAAYSRMIRKYYATEKPLPADQKVVQRLVGARTKEEREAVSTVLDEFFTLQDDGWHNTRCDEEIARYQDKQAKAKRSAEARWNKPRSHNEGNANALRTHNGELANNYSKNEKKKSDHGSDEKNKLPGSSISEQEISIKSKQQGMRSHTEGNAHQTPDTRHQTPEVKTHTTVPTVAGAVCVALRSEGMAQVNPSHPELLTLLEQGVKIEEFVSAGRIAREKGKGFAYVLGIVKGQIADAKRLAEEAAQHPAENSQRSRSRDRPLTQAEKRSQVAQFQFRNLPENRDASESNIIDITPANES